MMDIIQSNILTSPQEALSQFLAEHPAFLQQSMSNENTVVQVLSYKTLMKRKSTDSFRYARQTLFRQQHIAGSFNSKTDYVTLHPDKQHFTKFSGGLCKRFY
jgi:hypothetical protein